jgi:iron complex transport system permease protein
MDLQGGKTFTLLLAVTLTLFMVAVGHGSVAIPFNELLDALFSGGDSSSARIINEIRLPRVVIAFITGGLLALAGVMMQTMLQNPLADPYVLGTSGGAAVAVLFGFLFGIPSLLHPLLALLGAALSTLLLILIVGKQAGEKRETLLLAGIILTTGWGALVTFLLTIAPRSDLPGMLFWLIGDLGHSPYFLWPGMILLLLLVASLAVARAMNLMLLGDEHAQTLGVPVAKLRLLLLTMAVIATAIAVSVAGPVGFIGLVTPHLLRLIQKSDHRWLLPNSILLGGILVMAADLLARTLISPRELPVGVFTALIGAPVFLFLLRRQGRKA